MGVPLSEVVAAMPAKQRRAVKARSEELLAQQMTLAELRKVAGRTQVALAKKLGKPQATISRLEGQSDMLLSTLAETIAALGGRMVIMAELPGMVPVELSGLGDLTIPQMGEAKVRRKRLGQ